MEYKIIQTADGSDTIYVPDIDEHFHSVHGAIQESNFIYIDHGFRYCKADPVSILEIGFGTGLNAFLTAVTSQSDTREVNYTSIEKYPLNSEIIDSLNYGSCTGADGRDLFRRIHATPWNTRTFICKNFYLTKIEADFTLYKPAGCYDIIYFDAFGPDKQPSMWTTAVFNTIAEVTNKNGIFVTYSAKGEVKRKLRAVGFEVTLLPGPPGKRQMIRAIKI